MCYVLAPTQDKHFDLWIFKITFVLKKEIASSVSPKFSLTFIKGAYLGLLLLKIQEFAGEYFGLNFQKKNLVKLY